MQANEQALDILWREARTYPAWQDKQVEEALLRRLYDLCKWGPTSQNCCPMRVVFVKTQEAKERLKPCLAPGNVDKTMTAPVTAIIAYDMEFYEKLPTLWPASKDAKNSFIGKPEAIQAAAMRNGTLQGAYLMLAARALGLDCGPMGGFSNEKVDAEFFAGTSWKSNFLCNLGYGDKSKLYPRGPRLAFEEVCSIV